MEFLKLSVVSFGLFLWMGLNALLVAEEPSQSEVETDSLIPRAILFGNPVKAAPKISPDGNKLAYLAPDDNDVLNVYVRDLAGQDNSLKVTQDGKRGIRSYSWQFDNQHILYIQDKDGDENWHLYQTNILTKETKDLTPFENIQASILDYNRDYPNEMLLQINHRDPALFDVYRLKLDTGDLKLDTENTSNIMTWSVDDHSVVRMGSYFTKDGSVVTKYRESPQAEWKEWMKVGPLESFSVLEFIPNTNEIYAISNLESDTDTLIKMDLTTKKTTRIANDPNYDVSNILLDPKTRALQGIATERDKLEWKFLDSSIKNDMDLIEKKLGAAVIMTSRNLDDTRWIVVTYSDVSPSDYYFFDRLSKKLEFLFTTKPALKKYDLRPMQPIEFKARDGMNLHAYLTLPKGKGPFPTVIYVHGGPWVRDSWGCSTLIQWLANRGYGVLQINYRGSTGYGKKYMNAGNREWAGKMHTDLLDGKEWLVSHGYADPSKVAIMGGSYGGYATLVGLTFTPEAFCCGIDIVGISNLLTFIKTIPPYWGPARPSVDVRVGNIDTEPEFLKERSPLFKADRIVKPLLIAQGANDPRVNQAESNQIVEVMRKHGIPVDYLFFSDEGHGFARPANNMVFYAAAEAFLAKYLGGRFQPASPAESAEPFKK